MSAHLADQDIETAVRILNRWEGKLSWQKFIEEFRKSTGKSTTRQAVHQLHPRIRDAFQEAKIRHREALAGQPDLKRHMSKGEDGVRRLMAQVKRLREENETIKNERKALLEQFARWQYNAHVNGLTIEVLNRPVPSPRSKRKQDNVVPIRP